MEVKLAQPATVVACPDGDEVGAGGSADPGGHRRGVRFRFENYCQRIMN
jgi:hypothetical protein